MTELVAGLGSLLAGAAAVGGWYLLRAQRDRLDSDTEAKRIETLILMWETAVERCDDLDSKYAKCYRQKRQLETAARTFGMPGDLIASALVVVDEA